MIDFNRHLQFPPRFVQEIYLLEDEPDVSVIYQFEDYSGGVHFPASGDIVTVYPDSEEVSEYRGCVLKREFQLFPDGYNVIYVLGERLDDSDGDFLPEGHELFERTRQEVLRERGAKGEGTTR